MHCLQITVVDKGRPVSTTFLGQYHSPRSIPGFRDSCSPVQEQEMPSSESSRSEEETTERSSMLPASSQQSKTLQWQDAEEWDEDLEMSDEEDQLRADRRIYGGKHEGRNDTGDRSVTQVSMDVALTILSGTPLIIPAAIQATGLTVGIPLLFLVAFLSWVSHVVLNVERRYVGGFNIARAVFPSSYGGSYIGQILIDMLILVAAGLRTVITLSLSLQLVRIV